MESNVNNEENLTTRNSQPKHSPTNEENSSQYKQNVSIMNDDIECDRK